MSKKIELLAPAGNFEKLKVAIHYGADAVYVGLDNLSLRANADNFSRKELEEAIDYVHNHNKKIYIALNIYFTPDQKEKILDAINFVNKIRPDAVIISDMGLFYLLKKEYPEIKIHISTQANTTNQFAVKFYKELGAKRIVMARELTIENIKKIRSEVMDIELEAFVHGAMCIAYSGRCILSSYMTKKNLGSRPNENGEIRSANKGDCSHSCRWEFLLKEKTRPDDTFEISEDENGTYILSSKDICMINYLKDLMEAGIDSFKIEGRMKSILYLSSIVRSYRYALDKIENGEVLTEEEKRIIYDELNVVSHREFSTGFYFDSPLINANVTDNIEYQRNVRLAGLIEKGGEFAKLKVYNKISVSDKLELITKRLPPIKIGKIEFYKDGELVSFVNHTEEVYCKIFDENNNQMVLNEFDIIRMEAKF